MDKLTAEIIKNQMIGETSGHMANIPNNPILFSLYKVYFEQSKNSNYNIAFVEFIEELGKALKG